MTETRLDAVGQEVQIGDKVGLAFRGGTSDLTIGSIIALHPVKYRIEFKDGTRLRTVNKMPSQIVKLYEQKCPS